MSARVRLKLATLLLSTLSGCSGEPREAIPEVAAARDRAAVASFIDAARRRDFAAMSRRFEKNTEFIVDGRRRRGEDVPRLFADSIGGCRTPNIYAFAGNSLDPAAWDGGVIVVSDWACEEKGRKSDMSWTFSWRKGKLWRLDNNPVVL